MTDRELLTLYEQKFRQAGEEVVIALKMRDAAQEQLDKANAAAQSWKTIVAQAKDQLGETDKPTSKEAPTPVNGNHDVNRVSWILKAVVDSGSRGMIGPEVYRLAKQSGLTMHTNYPYVVLGKLVERGFLVKRGTRYYAAKEGSK